jgi:prepilin-type N-terminal cleavage/methylation domain-containing protein
MNQKGFSLIETLVGVAVFLTVSLAGYQAFTVLINAVLASEAKIAATEVANERFEIIRNLPYEDVGIFGGLPVGVVQREETILRDNYTFELLYTIRSIDNVFDGTLGGTPNDLSPADYKLIDLDIICPNCKVFSPLKFTTIVAPHSLETASTNGALFVQVFNSNGLPVQGVSVNIVNTNTDPDTIIDETTDNDGWLRIIDAPPGVNAYSISVTKNGYSGDNTYPIGGLAGDNPVNVDPTVVAQQVTQASFSIDQLSILNISSFDSSCVAKGNIDYSLTGTKLIGAPNVLKYDTTNFNTNASGISNILNMEWDTYTLENEDPSYDIIGIKPFYNFDLNPNQTLNTEIFTVPKAGNTLFVSIEDTDGNPINNAEVRLERSSVSFDETKETGIDRICSLEGQVYWDTLPSGTYDLTITKTDYEVIQKSITVSDYNHEKITLITI